MYVVDFDIVKLAGPCLVFTMIYIVYCISNDRSFNVIASVNYWACILALTMNCNFFYLKYKLPFIV